VRSYRHPVDGSPRRPHVIILGGGFGGVGAAVNLRDADVDVTLVDRNDYHTFQPLLYQVATDLLETSAVGHPLRDLFHEHPHVTMHEGIVTGIDLDARRVDFARRESLTYDYLVIALGAQVTFFGVEGAVEHAFPLYTLADAVRLRSHILQMWEDADRDPNLVDAGVLNVAIVGGGPTGVESAGALAELYRREFAEDYPAVPQDKARVILIEAGDDLLGMFRSDIRSYARRALTKRGVEVRTGEVVASVDADQVTLRSGEVIPTRTLVWGAGLVANPVVRTLGVDLQRGDRLPTEPDGSLVGHPEVFAVGDIAWTTVEDSDRALPQLGSVAMQAGAHAAHCIALLAAGKPTEPFRYHDKGTMATIGRGAAVAQTRGGHTMKGRTAWLAWGAVHLALLSTGEDRAKAAVDWTWAGFTHERSGRISVRTEEP
jgi:NADH:quinone reductase (non-electrogenic)